MPYFNNGNKVPDTFQAFLVENATFTSFEEYPILDQSKIPNSIPKKIITFDKINNYKGNKKECAVCFYCNDDSFKRIKRNPKAYINMLKQYKALIGFDFSIHTDMPLIKQKEQINTNLSLTYFFGENGSNYYPNLRCGNEETIDDYLKAIPKHSIISIGTYGFIKTKEEIYEWYVFLLKTLPIIKPKKILVYGTLNNSIFNDLKNEYEFVFYESYMSKFYKEAKYYGNEKCKS